MTSVLVLHPYLRPVGGANLVAAWAIQALSDSFAVSLATLEDVDFAAVNRHFGTLLQPDLVRVRVAPASYRAVLRVARTPSALVDVHLALRWAKRIDRETPFDVLLSTQNEVDFGRPGIQYVNLPDAYRADRGPRRASHRVPGLHHAFQTMCRALSGSTREGVLRNLFVADSQYIAREIADVYGAGSVVLYPPVALDCPTVPWADRRAGAIAVGRLHRSKRWEDAVAIVETVRHAGHDVTLMLTGHRDDEVYETELRSLGASRPWFQIVTDVDRAALANLIASHRYGLHTMPHEHFGIGPAEILSAGCIPFVHAAGGPAEIVADERLTFASTDEAAAKMIAVIESRALEGELVAHLAGRARVFHVDTFCLGLQEIVGAFSRR